MVFMQHSGTPSYLSLIQSEALKIRYFRVLLPNRVEVVRQNYFVVIKWAMMSHLNMDDFEKC